jgi:hypothetical protein
MEISIPGDDNFNKPEIKTESQLVMERRLAEMEGQMFNQEPGLRPPIHEKHSIDRWSNF